MKTTTILSNGLTVITNKKEEANSSILSYWVKAGGDNEKNYPYGIAHFIEHNLFNGTKTRTKEQIQKEIYAVGGEFNASTSGHMTNYYTVLPKEDWKLGVDVLTDMLFNSLLTDEMLEKEKKIVIQEIHRSDDDFNSFRPLMKAMRKNRPELESVLGTVDSVNSIQREDVLRFMNEFYQPKNMAFIVTGNVNHEELCELLEQLVPAKEDEEIKRPELFTQEDFNTEEIVLEQDINQTHYRFAMYGPGPNNNDRYAVKVLTQVLGGGMDSRLFQKIREEKGMAYAVSLADTVMNDFGLIYGYVGTTPENIEIVKQLISDEFNDVKQNSITEEELKHTKTFLKGRSAINRDDKDYEHSLTGTSFLFGKEVTIEEYRELIDAITLEDIKRVANKYFKEDKMIKYFVQPKK